MATVLLVAITITVAALLGSWFTSTTRTQAGIIEESMTTQVNCSSASLEIVDVTCSNTTQQIKVIVTNLGNDISLYNFSTLVTLNNTYYLNNTGGPNSISPLDPGEQAILTYFCSNTQYCIGGVKVSKIRVSPYNCPQAYTEKSFSDKSC